ncbi:2-succinyl-6-hydroxy-2,4-cyclohexadiene-1-carboxylate synthase [Veronia nyctiphanis]|uniref:2-succinyl-6-hydroxy-2, 4-cyclohexadiene-1-carboxylate synthase n=1 Tax=Veronia nyctiphanis TaxID=1278244 RepID=A0A4Q0YR65_9GAMM|nr:alpha/beta hydrolase [Veronia nyctiphanis]RXJ73582.1 2-succinyl-6-hydroxy-2,4-cyclohexadiene-1-carboxylate synthase [Veronia nyctiphanis]
MTRKKMKEFEHNGRIMSFLDEGEGPVILFGHDYMLNSEMWRPQINRLKQHYRCIVPDFWGHGESESLPANTKSLIDYAKDIKCLVEHLSIDRFSVVGLGSGAIWAAELALLSPTNVEKLVLMGTFIGYEPEITRDRYLDTLKVVAAEKHIPAEIHDNIVKQRLSTRALKALPQAKEYLENTLAQVSAERAIWVSDAGQLVFNRRDITDDASQFNLPVLLMVGAEDRVHSPLEAQLMRDEISQSQLVVLPQAGHLINLESPLFVSDTLISFLSE